MHRLYSYIAHACMISAQFDLLLAINLYSSRDLYIAWQLQPILIHPRIVIFIAIYVDYVYILMLGYTHVMHIRSYTYVAIYAATYTPVGICMHAFHYSYTRYALMVVQGLNF